MVIHKILVIDDDLGILEVVHEILSYEGFQVESLLTCRDIVQAVLQYGPHLVIMDYLLQGETGGMHCQKLKDTKSTRHIPVLLYSAYPYVGQSPNHFGCDDFLAKPFGIAELTAKVRNLLEPKFVPAPLDLKR